MKNVLFFPLFATSFLAAVSIVSSNDAPRWPMFEKHQLDAGANEAATVADINRDGRLDIVSGENWYEAPEWKKHRMRSR